MTKAFSYNKHEKLKRRTQLEALFAAGKSCSVFPIKAFYGVQKSNSTELVKAGVGVSARHFKKAVDRNRIKRLLREAYRLEKNILHQHVAQQQQQLTIFFLYLDKTLPKQKLLSEKMKLVMEKVVRGIVASYEL